MVKEGGWYDRVPVSISEWLLASLVLILSNSTNIHKYWRTAMLSRFDCRYIFISYYVWNHMISNFIFLHFVYDYETLTWLQCKPWHISNLYLVVYYYSLFRISVFCVWLRGSGGWSGGLNAILRLHIRPILIQSATPPLIGCGRKICVKWYFGTLKYFN